MKITWFCRANGEFCERVKTQVKEIYDFAKREETKGWKNGALRELVTQNFDLEQIWQQIELQNESLLTSALISVSKLVVNKSGLTFGVDHISESSDYDNSEDNSSADKSDNESVRSDTNEEEEEEENAPLIGSPKPAKTSVVDDDFFNLNEMEKFLEAEEKKLSKSQSDDDDDESESEASIDLFEGSDSEDDAKQAKYKDFFVAQDPVKSSHELKQTRLNKKIEEIEEKAVEEKSWQLKGEVTGESRPQNSLLEEIVEFDLTSRPAPVITEQTTMQLEDIIKQRIKDKVFDSVERKAKPVETPLEYKKKLVLEQEKSKESLAQIYEKEFLQQQASLAGDTPEEKEPELHTEINSLMKDLFTKMDALSNFHFTPKPAVPELKIISNLPAISMEEVAPVVVSDATLLAPEEIKNKTKGDIVGKNERTTTDKKRERRKKKLKQKIHAKEREKRGQLNKTGVNRKSKKDKTNNVFIVFKEAICVNCCCF